MVLETEDLERREINITVDRLYMGQGSFMCVRYNHTSCVCTVEYLLLVTGHCSSLANLFLMWAFFFMLYYMHWMTMFLMQKTNKQNNSSYLLQLMWFVFVSDQDKRAFTSVVLSMSWSVHAVVGYYRNWFGGEQTWWASRFNLFSCAVWLILFYSCKDIYYCSNVKLETTKNKSNIAI